MREPSRRDDDLAWHAIRTAQMCKDGKPIRLIDEIRKAIALARAEERAACAKLPEEWTYSAGTGGYVAMSISEKIRRQ